MLEEIIEKINERFDGIFSEGDRVIVETRYSRAKDNKKLNQQAEKNDEEVYTKSIFPEVVKEVAQDCYMEQMKAFSKQNPSSRKSPSKGGLLCANTEKFLFFKKAIDKPSSRCYNNIR